MNSRKYVIIGSGVAGISAVQAIRQSDSAGEINIVSEDPFGYYSRPGLAYYLTGELDAASLFPFRKKDIQELRVHWHQTGARHISSEKHHVILSNQAALSFDRLLIATGSLAVPLIIQGSNLAGVYKLDNLSDAQAILKACKKARSAVVVGGGITALELVEGLRANNIQVHYLLRGARYWNNVLDETESVLVEERLSHEGVKIHYQAEAAEIKGHKNKVSGILLKNGSLIQCEIVVYAIGVQPRLELGISSGLHIDRGIRTNEYMQTSAEDIFAAGDVAQAFDPYIQKSVLDTLWNPARHQGDIAGRNMSGSQTEYHKRIAFNVTRLAGITTTIIGTVGSGIDPSIVGIARGDSETWRHMPNAVIVERTHEINRLRLIIGETRLIGALLMGNQELSRPLQELIDNRVDIAPIREVLLSSPRPADVLLSFWMNWSSNHDNQK